MTTNLAILLGRLQGEPEMRYTPSGQAVTNFRIGTARYAAREESKGLDFHNVIVWGDSAGKGEGAAGECARRLHKGSLVQVTGRIQTRSYEDKNGEKKYVTEIVANSGGVQFLDGGGEES